MKKGLSYLIESELEKAEVVLAAKSITDAIQKMAETAAKWEADDVMPLNDPIREHFGPEAAAAFSEAVSGKLRELVKILGDTKNAVSDEIARMQGELSGEPQSDLATMDDESAIGDGASGDGQSDLSAELPTDDGAELPADPAAAPAPEAPAAPAADAPKFGDEEMGSLKAAGRARKESAEPLGKMLEAALNELSAGTLGNYAAKAQDRRSAAITTKDKDGYIKAKRDDAMSDEDKEELRKRSAGLDKVRAKNAKVNESADRAVAQEYVSMIREGKSASEAASALTESYGLTINDLVEIMEAAKKRKVYIYFKQGNSDKWIYLDDSSRFTSAEEAIKQGTWYYPSGNGDKLIPQADLKAVYKREA